ncbi:tRNA pseudouridine synthase A [Vitis vinifera]|uniref:tRNA pseudouridine synthase n=1 Tax=Vitis vinifera TaxID=29760 RepID=A0A438G5F3_VITVI|nr:tRNA pseudouridine synthase A [Vitis vinifera]
MLSPGAVEIGRDLMENEKENKVYVHYTHTHPTKFSRWTARESHQFMYKRPWQQVLDFYSNVVTGRCSLLGLLGIEVGLWGSSVGLVLGLLPNGHRFESPQGNWRFTQSLTSGHRGISRELSPQTHPIHDGEIVEASDKTEFGNVLTKDRGGRWARLTFKIVLSYHGASFDGWQKQPGLNTVQGWGGVVKLRVLLLMKPVVLVPLVEASLGRFVDERKAQQLKEKNLPVEGMVTVAGRTDKGVTALQQVCSFYTWKKDVKVQDIEDAINGAAPGKLRVISVSEVSRIFHPNFSAKWRHYFYIFPLNDGDDGEQISENEMDIQKISFNEKYGEQGSECPAQYNEVHQQNVLSSMLEPQKPDYNFLSDDGEGTKVMCIELVANRFLRKMVRVLVATSIREAAAGAEQDALLKLMDATCRRATAPPAPPDGLCLIDVGFTEFDPQICFIR